LFEPIKYHKAIISYSYIKGDEHTIYSLVNAKINLTLMR